MNQDNDKFDDNQNTRLEAFKLFFALAFFPFSAPLFWKKAAEEDKPKKKPKPMPTMTWKHLRIFLLTTFIILAGMTACLFHFPWTS